ncbi:MAG: hypothetical protein MI862_26525 [Desulfobacterales bacterium]|nr:hypothetical protein [Desulfobacterales bacterium]
MESETKTFIEIDNIAISDGKTPNPKMEYDMIKAMIPIYVFHRSQGCDEKEAYDRAYKEMGGIIKSFLKKHIKPGGQ